MKYLIENKNNKKIHYIYNEEKNTWNKYSYIEKDSIIYSSSNLNDKELLRFEKPFLIPEKNLEISLEKIEELKKDKNNTYKEIVIVDDKTIKEKIYVIRGQRVMLDTDLAEIYGYSTRTFNQQVRNNIEKFDDDFMFILDKSELENLRSNFLTANISPKSRALPYVFTEQGIYMLMTVLKGELAIKQSKALIRTFKQMKDFIVENQDFIGSKELVQIAIQTNQNTNDIKQNSKEIFELNSKMDTLATKEDLKKVMDHFIDPDTYKHFLLMNGDKIEADVAYTKIYKSAK